MNTLALLCLGSTLTYAYVFAVYRLPAEPASQADNNTAEMLDSENGELHSDKAH